MNRRGFLGSILAACAAPAIVRADSLMRVVPRATAVLPLEFHPLTFSFSTSELVLTPMAFQEIFMRDLWQRLAFDIDRDFAASL